MINCFCCYVIKSAGEVANKVLLSVVLNSLLIEINVSQIRALDIKCEKVCAVCPYLLLDYVFTTTFHFTSVEECYYPLFCVFKRMITQNCILRDTHFRTYVYENFFQFWPILPPLKLCYNF